MTGRGTFDEEDDARGAAAELRERGFAVDVVRDRFAGEDDDEDHAWAVVGDVPPEDFGAVVEAHGGWFETDEPRPPAPAPLDLPLAPRRTHRGGRGAS